MSEKALFLDRDGVINYDYGYVHGRENFNFIPGIFDLARNANKKKYKIVVITNQSGIARGFYSESIFLQLTDWMCQQFLEAGAPIEKVYFSPYHPTAGIGQYLKNAYCRKPNPGMILKAQEELSIDLTQSILVGDKLSDIQAGNSAGVGKNLLIGKERPDCSESLHYSLVNSLYDVMGHL